MLSVQQADDMIRLNVKLCPPVRVTLREAFGCVLREDIRADRDLPPFDRVAMDGIAISWDSWRKGRREFVVEGVQKAGTPVQTLKNQSHSIEVMTGAVLPKGCDCVIPVENIEIDGRIARLREGFKISRWLNIHPRGTEYKRGAILLRKGCRLLSAQIAVAASVGKPEVRVSRSPSIAVVGTGDELVEVGKPIAPFQIRQSNAYALECAFQMHGYRDVRRFHLKDDKEKLRLRLKDVLQKFDVVVLSGGVSMGKFDFVPEVLERLRVKVLFHKVKQRPGKPFWFGKSRDGKPVFALPGNPVSTLISAYRYILPYLNQSSGLDTTAAEFAVLEEDVEVKTPLTSFLPVKIAYHPDGRLAASPVHTHGSGDYASLAQSDGFVELKEDTPLAGRLRTYRFPKGSVSRLYRW